MQLFFQSIILYIIYGPGTSNAHSRNNNFFFIWISVAHPGRPFDLRSLLSSSNDSIPYFYFILLTSSIISVGLSFARILTKGKNPIIPLLSLKFLKVILMLILKFLVQSYILSMAVKSLMYKFVSKERKVLFYIYLHLLYIYLLNLILVSIFFRPHTRHWGLPRGGGIQYRRDI